MPLSGVRDVSPLLAQAPELADLKTQPAELRGAEILHVMYEIASGEMLAILPQALHPTIPPTMTFWVWHCPESEAGPFTLAQVRIGSRAGVRPRGWPTAAYCDSARAGEWLSRRWGFPCRQGDVRLRHLHDRVLATVQAGGSEILRVELVDPQPISGADVQYTASMHLARVPLADGVKPRLVQVDPEFTFHKAERGRPHLHGFDRAAWRAEGVDPVYAVSATYAVADVTLPRIRYIMNPDLPAMQGTETVG
ncbi:MAG TPA: acetoacetate decarboxylase family protein [Dehalococcoidia bacterium]|nr:acetoacetate decarboxylase family protein [Dehalococcoidia bacterium]